MTTTLKEIQRAAFNNKCFRFHYKPAEGRAGLKASFLLKEDLDGFVSQLPQHVIVENMYKASYHIVHVSFK